MTDISRLGLLSFQRSLLRETRKKWKNRTGFPKSNTKEEQLGFISNELERIRNCEQLEISDEVMMFFP
jgi:hypothetical protein